MKIKLCEHRHFGRSAKLRAEYYVILYHAKALLSDLAEFALSVAILCVLDTSGEINRELTTAWMDEAKRRVRIRVD